MYRSLLALMAVLAVFAVASFATADGVFKKTETGTPKIESIDAITFGPDGVLLIGDSKGAQVVAIDTKDTKGAAWKAGAIEGFAGKVAGKLGTKEDKIEFKHLAVNRASGTVYIVVRKLDEKKSVIVTISGDGKIGEANLEKVNYVAVPLPKEGKSGVTKITDVAWAKDRILVGAASNEEFSSKVFSIATPLDSTKQASGFSTETYHVAHGKWETKAPMQTIIPLEQKGKQYVVGAFQCTPVVRYPLEDVKEGTKVKGTSVIELGNGNMPMNMFPYSKEGKTYLLINHRRGGKAFGDSKYWVARLDMALFDETENVNEKAPWRVERKSLKPINDKVQMIDAYSGAIYMDKIDDKLAAVIKEGKDGKGFKFEALELP